MLDKNKLDFYFKCFEVDFVTEYRLIYLESEPYKCFYVSKKDKEANLILECIYDDKRNDTFNFYYDESTLKDFINKMDETEKLNFDNNFKKIIKKALNIQKEIKFVTIYERVEESYLKMINEKLSKEEITYPVNTFHSK